MDKKKIRIDTINRRFQFKLESDEFAHIGFGANIRIWNVDNIIITKGEQTYKIDGNSYDEFELRSSLFKYTGFIEISN